MKKLFLGTVLLPVSIIFSSNSVSASEVLQNNSVQIQLDAAKGDQYKIEVTGTGYIDIVYIKAVLKKFSPSDSGEVFEDSISELKALPSILKSNSVTVKMQNTIRKKDPLYGYTAYKYVTVELRDLSLLKELVNKIALIDNLDFEEPIPSEFKNKQQAQIDTDRLAIKDAQDKAENIAKTLGIKLETPLNISIDEKIEKEIVTLFRRLQPINSEKIKYTSKAHITYQVKPKE
ncbi:MAG: SIMPL domain-containing protein [Succinivibrio sp.]